MAKVLEGPGMGLLKKWGVQTPNYAVVSSFDEFEQLAQANDWLKNGTLVVKAHEALGSRFKLGLVKVGLDLSGAKTAVKEILGRKIETLTIDRSSCLKPLTIRTSTTPRSSRPGTGPILWWPTAAGLKWSQIGIA